MIAAAAPAKLICTMQKIDPAPFLDDLKRLAVVEPDLPLPPDMAMYHHTGGDAREMTLIFSIDVYDLYQANAYHFGIRRWRHVSVSIRGALGARLADQRKIGRTRAGGERSPAPLPDWYELSHVAYEHAAEFGFIRTQPVFQLLPPPTAEYLNIAEALHLRQPA